jgi:porin
MSARATPGLCAGLRDGLIMTSRMHAIRRPRASQCLAWLSGVALTLGFVSAARGQNLRHLATETQLSGDWGGARTKLEQDGFKVTFQYWTNIAGNPVGGLDHGFTYTDSFNLSLDFDLEKLVKWNGGSFHVIFTNRDGSSLSKNYIGNIFTVQQIYGPTETYRLTAMTVEQSFAGGTWDVVAGRYPASDFATSALYCVFMNNGFCGYPGGIAQNLNMPYFPVPSWGGRVRWKPRADLQVQVGAMEVNPTLADTHGFDWSTSGGTGTAIVGEVWYVRGGGAPGLPGHYKLGGWYQTQTQASGGIQAPPPSSLDAGPAAFSRRLAAAGTGKAGAYALVDQAVTEGMPAGRGIAEVPAGVTLLGGVSWAQGPNTVNDVAAFGGAVANGLIACRPFDTQGFALTWVNRTVPGQTYELVLEWNYGVHVTPWFTFQPDVQWVIRPGATGQIPNALVLGAQAVIDF